MSRSIYIPVISMYGLARIRVGSYNFHFVLMENKGDINTY